MPTVGHIELLFVILDKFFHCIRIWIDAVDIVNCPIAPKRGATTLVRIISILQKAMYLYMWVTHSSTIQCKDYYNSIKAQ